jgi:hypothetical protein
MERIDAENLKLLKRIQQAKPTHSRSSLESDHKQQKKIMHMRCEHRKDLGLPPPAPGKLPRRRGDSEADTWEEDLQRICPLEERLRAQYGDDEEQPAPAARTEPSSEPPLSQRSCGPASHRSLASVAVSASHASPREPEDPEHDAEEEDDIEEERPEELLTMAELVLGNGAAVEVSRAPAVC